MISEIYHYKINIKKKGVFLLFFFFSFFSFSFAKDFTPIEYKGGYYSPYTWDQEFVSKNGQWKLLALSSIREVWNSSVDFDVAYFREAEKLLRRIYKEEDFLLMERISMRLIQSIPNPIEIKPLLGKEIEKGKYAGAKRYLLITDPSKKSIVTLFDDGAHQIDYADGSSYFHNKDYYFKNNTKGDTEYLVYANGDAVLAEGDSSLSLFADGSYSLKYRNKGDLWQLDCVQKSPTQYLLKTPLSEGGKPYLRVWIVPSEKSLGSSTLFITDQLRLDFFFDDETFLFSDGKNAVLLNPDYSKVLSGFDKALFSPKGVTEFKKPEGVSYANLNGKKIKTEFNPGWQENFKKKSLGEFDFWLQEKDFPFLDRLNAKKLSEISTSIESFLSLKLKNFSAPIVIPPSLKSFGSLYAKEKNQYIGWYPSGFQLQNYIVFWPFSLPRYQEDLNQDYFFEDEFYSTLAHEYTHLLLADSIGYLSTIPVWLNEGIAVNVEARYASNVKKRWEEIFKEAFREGRLLDWDKMVEKASGDYAFRDANTYYAQSYEMIQFLLQTEGKEKVIAYVKSFQREIFEDKKTLSDLWRGNFQKVFGFSWEKNCEKFYEFALNLF